MIDHPSIDEIVDLHKAGKSPEKIAWEVGYSRQTVKKMLMGTEYYYQIRREKSDQKIKKAFDQLNQPVRNSGRPLKVKE